ncbi:hypothetical protein ACFE04_023292 [Oxalis oulophora]
MVNTRKTTIRSEAVRVDQNLQSVDNLRDETNQSKNNDHVSVHSTSKSATPDVVTQTRDHNVRKSNPKNKTFLAARSQKHDNQEESFTNTCSETPKSCQGDSFGPGGLIEKEVQRQLQLALGKGMSILPSAYVSSSPPFTEEIMKELPPDNFKLPSLKRYDGTGDPNAHISSYEVALLVYHICDAIKCKVFLQTLRGPAQEWYKKLPPKSIASFEQLGALLVNQFLGGHACKKITTSLNSIVQRLGESLKSYFGRFTREALSIPRLDHPMAVLSMTKGTTNSALQMALAKKPPKTMN